MADPPSTPPWSTSSSTPSSPPFSAPKGPPIVRFPAAQYVPPAPKNPVKNQGTQTKLDDDKTTDEEADSLNTEFGTLKHSSFFTVGKVFITRYVTRKGESSKTPSGIQSSQNTTTVRPGVQAYHKPRRFIVVSSAPGERFSYCCAIYTYNFQGVKEKPPIDQAKHAIVYTGETPPQPHPDESHMDNLPVKIIPISSAVPFHPMSRVHIPKEIPVDHNWRVVDVGDVEPRSLSTLLAARTKR